METKTYIYVYVYVYIYIYIYAYHHLIQQVFPSPVSCRRNPEEYSFVLRPPPGGVGGRYSQQWSSIRTEKPVGKSRVRAGGRGGATAFPPAPSPGKGMLYHQVPVSFPSSLSSFALSTCLPPHLQRVEGWAPCVGAEQSEPFGLKNLQSHLTQPRDLSAPPSHPSWLQQSWAWWPLLVPSFLDRVSSPGFTLPSYTHPTPLPHTPKQSSLQELSCG